MSTIGLVLKLTYRLRRYFWLGWSLARWWGLLLAVLVVWALIRWWPHPWLAAILGLLLLAYVAVLVWAARLRFVRFETMPNGQYLLHGAPPSPPLRTQELVPVRASGWFTVEGQSQYYVDIEADFETVGTREHIILGRVHPSRFLLFGVWPKQELGWWYIFVQPTMIRQIDLGHLHFGRRSQLVLRVIYAPGEDAPQAAYLTFKDTTALRRVWDNLLLDAPEAVVAASRAAEEG